MKAPPASVASSVRICAARTFVQSAPQRRASAKPIVAAHGKSVVSFIHRENRENMCECMQYVCRHYIYIYIYI